MIKRDLALMELPTIQAWVVIGFNPTTNKYSGYVENSFSMSLSEDRTNLLWTGKAHTAFFEPFDIDGNAASKDTIIYLTKEHPEFIWKAYNIHDSSIPFVFDWDEWRFGSGRSTETMSGVRNKYLARNPRFEIKECN